MIIVLGNQLPLSFQNTPKKKKNSVNNREKKTKKYGNLLPKSEFGKTTF